MSKRGSLIFLAVLLASLLPSLLRIAWPFLTSFILASILAIVINPANKWLSRRVHRPGLATFLTTFATVLSTGNHPRVCRLRFDPGIDDHLRRA